MVPGAWQSSSEAALANGVGLFQAGAIDLRPGLGLTAQSSSTTYRDGS